MNEYLISFYIKLSTLKAHIAITHLLHMNARMNEFKISPVETSRANFETLKTFRHFPLVSNLNV